MVMRYPPFLWAGRGVFTRALVWRGAWQRAGFVATFNAFMADRAWNHAFGETSPDVRDAVISQAGRDCSSSPPVLAHAPSDEGASGVGAAITGSRGSSV